MTRSLPALRKVTVGTGSGSGRRAAASRAAILGVACRASWLQPPVSRMFTKRITDVVAPASSASAVNSCFSWVQATTRSSPWARACMNAGASRRHRVE